MGGVIAGHTMLGFKIADDLLDGRAAPQLAVDRLRDTAVSPRDEHPKTMRRGRIAATIDARRATPSHARRTRAERKSV
jgi:hypothetical protein